MYFVTGFVHVLKYAQLNWNVSQIMTLFFSWTHCLTLVTLANQITLSDCSVVNKLFGGEYLTQINLSSESYHIDKSVFFFHLEEQ